METWLRGRWMLVTWCYTILKHLKPEHVALALMLALFVYSLTGKAEGDQVSGPPSPSCPLGMVWAQVSIGEYGAVYFCAPADIMERKQVQIKIEGRDAVNCRVLAVRGK